MMAAEVFAGRQIDTMVECGIAPGSRQVLELISESGGLTKLVAAGARILESGCGPCIGQGFAPGSNVVSLRTFNRNFSGRSGTKNDQVYLVSPETAVASAIMGEITDPRDLKTMMGISYPKIKYPKHFEVDDNMIQKPVPADQAGKVEVLRGPTIVVPESPKPLPENLTAQVLLKCGDKITTDHIMPAGPFLKYRSNVPVYSQYVFNCFNEEGQPTFAERALALKEKGIGGIVVGGESYGQGSSREHAALCPMYLGVRAVIAKSMERIHKANLINFCIVPLEFANPADYDAVSQDDTIEIPGLVDAVEKSGRSDVSQKNQRQGNQGNPVDFGTGPRVAAGRRPAGVYAKGRSKIRRGIVMAKKIVAIVGTYRPGRVIDSAVDELLRSAQSEGVQTEKIMLLDKHIEFCSNCRMCTQQPGQTRGVCPLDDQMNDLLDKLEAADAIVLASPINFGNVTALMKRFIERLVCYAWWPWDLQKAPVLRVKKATKPAVLVTASACPAFIGRWLMANPRKTLKAAAKCLGAKPFASLYFGLVATGKDEILPESKRVKTRQQGIRLARAL